MKFEIKLGLDESDDVVNNLTIANAFINLCEQYPHLDSQAIVEMIILEYRSRSMRFYQDKGVANEPINN